MNVRSRVEEAIRAALCDALEIDESEVVDDARVMADLGAESIDLLDIRFRLERALGLKISDDELVRAFSETRSGEEFQRRFTVGAMRDWLVSRVESEVE